MTWRAQVEPVWRQTEQFKRIEYRRVEVASWKLLALPGEWPSDLRWIVEDFRKTEDGQGRKQGWSPRFFVVAGRQTLFTTTGHYGFREIVVPKLRELVGA